MKSNPTFYLPNQQKTIKQPFISSHLDSSPQNQKVDVVKLINKQEQSRVTKVDIKSYRSITKNNQNNAFNLQKPMLFDKIEEEQKQNERIKPKKQKEKYYQNRATQTFLNNYENNSLLGFAFYLVFMLFNSAQVLTSSYFASQYQNNTFYKNKGIFLILFSQLVYYLIVRFINTKTHIKLYTQSSITHSVKNMLSSKTSNKLDIEHSNSLKKILIRHPYILLSLLVGSILCSQAIYCWVVTQSLMLFKQGSIYLVSTIYWSNFVLPVLMTFFYINGHDNNKNWKIIIFPYLLAGFIINILFQSKLLVVLSVMKLIQSYLLIIQGVEMFHLNQLSKITLLVIWCLVSLIQNFSENGGSFFKENALKQGLFIVVQSAVVAFSFILTRIVADIFLKDQLYCYFYTQNHVGIAFVLTTILMYASYFDFSNQNNETISFHYVIACCFLVFFGIILYLEGKQKEQIKIEISLDEQQA